MPPKHFSLEETMARTTPLILFFFTTLFSKAISNPSIESSLMYPFNCSLNSIRTCNSYLYHISKGQNLTQLSNFYSVDTSQITPITNANKQDFLISVSCDCQNLDGVVGYFSNSRYRVQPGDMFANISDEIFSGQAWGSAGDGGFQAGEEVPIHLLCGCLENLEMVVTYTVQQHDTLFGIASLLSSNLDGIEKLNEMLIKNPWYIDVGWVLFVPMHRGKDPARKKGDKKLSLIIGISVSAALLATAILVVCFNKKKKAWQSTIEDPKTVFKCSSAKCIASLQNQYPQREDVSAFGMERPVIFSLDEIERATGNFDEARKIGEGGYGSVYFGILGTQEVAIKKMKSSKSKEFFAELKVLCKIHHINVVELIGYSSGDDHLYLVYEFVQNGSLSDHLHDPLLKGHQPLSWIARMQIALDAAKGIEYIHDHTKAQYVHRDIKTSNILLDEGLRAKVGDFGLAKLVDRNGEENCIATRLVGTPGYLPPESVRELQMTPKSDVFAFGVVLAELITGQRALIRDNREPNKMKSLISIIYAIFREDEQEKSLEDVMDGHLTGCYPLEEAYKMAEIAASCLSEDAINRPEMLEIVVKLSNIVTSSVEWEASLGGNSQVFSGLFNGR